ncbi:MAG: helix-turn-helix transcriptional regulator [Acidobacteriota bacterium]
MARQAGRIRPPAPRCTDPRIGRVIRAVRIGSQLTQAQLARKCRVSLRHVIAIEHGRNCTVAVLLAIIEHLPAAKVGLARLLLRRRDPASA